MLAEGATDIRIKCCVKKMCGKDLVGVYQDKHKNCKGSIVVYVFQFFGGVIWKRKKKNIYTYIYINILIYRQWKGDVCDRRTQNLWIVRVRNGGNYDLSSSLLLLQQQQLQSSLPQGHSFPSSSSSEFLPTDTSPGMVQGDRFQDNNVLGMDHAENLFTVGWKSNEEGGDDDYVPADWKLMS